MRSEGLTTRVRIDLGARNRPPAARRVVAAALLSVALSLAADALLVLAGTAVWSADKGYSHFQFWDYGALTLLGVVAAGLAWPLAVRVSSSAQWLFLRLAVVVSLVLLLPDVWLLAEGQPGRDVVVLVAMHAVIAVVTYNLLVRVSPAPTTAAEAPGIAPVARPTIPAPVGWWRRSWIGLSTLSSLTTVLGIVAIIAVPVNRKSVWVPTAGRDVYLAHAAAGGVLGLGAATMLLATLRADRVSLYSAGAGLIATGLGAAGGVLAVYGSVRYEGMALMLLGGLVAPFVYLAPIGLATTDPAVAPNREWQDISLACSTCGPVTAIREAAGLDEEAWVDRRASAGRCPLCPTRRLEAYKDVWICWCCETVYRRGSGAGVVWVVTPGERVARLRT